jgi:hypothetical protein
MGSWVVIQGWWVRVAVVQGAREGLAMDPVQSAQWAQRWTGKIWVKRRGCRENRPCATCDTNVIAGGGGGGELGVGDREGERGVSGGVEFGERSPGEQPCATYGALKSDAVVQKGSCAGAQPLHTLHTLHNADPSSYKGGLACGARNNHL